MDAEKSDENGAGSRVSEAQDELNEVRVAAKELAESILARVSFDGLKAMFCAKVVLTSLLDIIRKRDEDCCKQAVSLITQELIQYRMSFSDVAEARARAEEFQIKNEVIH